MEAGIYTLQYGTREPQPNIEFVHGYRVCQRCDGAGRLVNGNRVKATMCLVHPRRWWQLFGKSELLCESCTEEHSVAEPT